MRCREGNVTIEQHHRQQVLNGEIGHVAIVDRFQTPVGHTHDELFDITRLEPVLLDEIYALIPTTLDSGHRGTISFLELSHVPTLVLTGSSAIHRMLEKAQKSTGVTLNIKYEVLQVQTQIAMAAAGLGVAILPRIAIPAKPDPRLRAVPIVDPPLVRELCVVTLRGQLLSPVATRFVEMLQRMIGRPAAPATDDATDAPLPIRAVTRRRRTHLALASTQLNPVAQ